MRLKEENSEEVQEIQGVGKIGDRAYRIKTKGFTKQFSSYAASIKEFNKLQAKATREKRSFTIVLLGKNNRHWEELDKVQISKSFYDDEE